MSRCSILFLLLTCAMGQVTERPNILWITSEDNGPHLGCYGDPDAVTPHLDGLAARGLLYRTAWSNAPVCAPARTAIISGLHPPSTGSQHMRSRTRLPGGFSMFPQLLRQTGYYCTNNSKEDYNLAKPGKVWDASNRKAHWRNRKKGQPFFAVFNITLTHESGIRKRPHKAVHDPKKIRIPSYHPDTPKVRQDWAQYHDKMTEMDAVAGRRLEELEKAGLADDTIVFYYGDHGVGLPRSKRTPLDSGLRVPLLVHVPEKFRGLAPPDYKAGGSTDRLVGFTDLAPTVLSLAGMRPPTHYQGHAFMGRHIATPQPHIFGFRGRMDERIDMVRSVRNQDFVYVRNFMPHRPHGQHVAYMFQTPTTRVWRRLFDSGGLNAAQRAYWETRPAEELYDMRRDPDEVKNLAASEQHGKVLEEMRQALRQHLLAVRDTGFLPEAEMHRRVGDSTPYEMAHDPKRYPLERIFGMADHASRTGGDDTTQLRKGLADEDPAVRYWAALGLLIRGRGAVTGAAKTLRRALRDGSANVRIVAAEALGLHGNNADLSASLDVLISCARLGDNPVPVAVAALNAVDALGTKAAGVRKALDALPRRHASVHRREGNYVPRLLEWILPRLQTDGG